MQDRSLRPGRPGAVLHAVARHGPRQLSTTTPGTRPVEVHLVREAGRPVGTGNPSDQFRPAGGDRQSPRSRDQGGRASYLSSPWNTPCPTTSPPSARCAAISLRTESADGGAGDDASTGMTATTMRSLIPGATGPRRRRSRFTRRVDAGATTSRACWQRPGPRAIFCAIGGNSYDTGGKLDGAPDELFGGDGHDYLAGDRGNDRLDGGGPTYRQLVVNDRRIDWVENVEHHVDGCLENVSMSGPLDPSEVRDVHPW